MSRAHRWAKARPEDHTIDESYVTDVVDSYRWGDGEKLDAHHVGAILKVLLDQGLLTGYRRLATLATEIAQTADGLDALHAKITERMAQTTGPYAEALAAVDLARKAKKRVKQGV